MVDFYVMLIKKEATTLDAVPKFWKKEVEAKLNESD